MIEANREIIKQTKADKPVDCSSKRVLLPPPEPKVKVMIPMYESLETSKCKKRGKIIAELKELIRNADNNHFRHSAKPY